MARRGYSACMNVDNRLAADVVAVPGPCWKAEEASSTSQCGGLWRTRNSGLLRTTVGDVQPKPAISCDDSNTERPRPLGDCITETTSSGDCSNLSGTLEAARGCGESDELEAASLKRPRRRRRASTSDRSSGGTTMEEKDHDHDSCKSAVGTAPRPQEEPSEADVKAEALSARTPWPVQPSCSSSPLSKWRTCRAASGSSACSRRPGFPGDEAHAQDKRPNSERPRLPSPQRQRIVADSAVIQGSERCCTSAKAHARAANSSAAKSLVTFAVWAPSAVKIPASARRTTANAQVVFARS
mmetsp:Transcript_126798/g.405998  ORF Transcript_126798/g.405998 Transcript_126798/m.405998 type:complete len:298 (-) Transcript_126798:419-1312(-)